MRLCKRHPRHHHVVERRCCAGALRLQHCRWQLCSQDTHWLHFSVLALFTTTRLLRRFRRCQGRLLCGERVAVLAGRHCPGSAAPMSCTDPRHQKAAGRRRSVAIIAAGLGCGDMLTRHGAALVFFLVFLSPCGGVLVLRGGTRGGCCAGLLRLGSAIEGHVWESYQDTRRNLIFQ